MQTRELGNTGVRPSAPDFGRVGPVGWHGERDDAEAAATLLAAIDAGVNHFDTASRPSISTTCIASISARLTENIAAAEVALDAGEAAELAALFAKPRVEGDRHPPAPVRVLNG